MVLHKGLRPHPVMTFSSKKIPSHFNSPLCQGFLPTLFLWSWYGSQSHWVHVLRSPSWTVRARGLLLLHNSQHSCQPSPLVTVRAPTCRCAGHCLLPAPQADPRLSSSSRNLPAPPQGCARPCFPSLPT